GLSAPIGSLLIGDNSFINKARVWRKYLGGTMRQAGIIAAPGIIALNYMTKRLEDDHSNTRILVNELSKIKGISLDANNIRSNIIIANIKQSGLNAEEFVSLLKKNAILIRMVDTYHVRFTINRHIQKKDILE